MKIRVGDCVYDGSDQPIMVILNDLDKANIAKMPAHATKYCGHPPKMAQKEVDAWMANKGQACRLIEGKLCIGKDVRTVRIYGTVKPTSEEQNVQGIPDVEQTQASLQATLDLLKKKPDGEAP